MGTQSKNMSTDSNADITRSMVIGFSFEYDMWRLGTIVMQNEGPLQSGKNVPLKSIENGFS